MLVIKYSVTLLKENAAFNSQTSGCESKQGQLILACVPVVCTQSVQEKELLELLSNVCISFCRLQEQEQALNLSIKEATAKVRHSDFPQTARK